MVILCNWNGYPVTLSIKPNCLTVSVESNGNAQVFSYDHAGRLWTALMDDISYRRGLDGKIVAKWQTADGGRDRRWLDRPEALAIETRARRMIADLYAAIRAGATGTGLSTSRRPPNSGRMLNRSKRFLAKV